MRRTVVAAAAAVVSVVFAAPAHGFSITELKAAPASTQAGAGSNLTIDLAFGDGQVRDLDLHLPPGLVGFPLKTPRCAIADFEAGRCRAAAQVGTASSSVALLGLVPQTASGTIHNLRPRGGEPARLGITLSAAGQVIRLESPVVVRPSDNGLDSQIRSIPNTAAGLPLTITSMRVVLRGSFMRNPTSCAPAAVGADAVSYAEERATAKVSFTPTGCDQQPFDPQLDATIGAKGLTGKGTFPPISTVVRQGDGEAGLRDVTVTIPPVLGASIDRLGRACLGATFAAGQCAPEATVGQATAATPLLEQPLEGPVTFTLGANTFPDLVVALKGQLALTLRAGTEITAAGLNTKFTGLPDVPIARFALDLASGDRGLMVASRDLCVGPAPQLRASFVSHGGQRVERSVAATIAGCSPRRTKASIRVTGLRRGRPALRLHVDAGPARISRVRLRLPSGLRLTRRGGRVRVGGQGVARPRVARRAHELTVSLRAPGATTLTVSVPARALRLLKGLAGARELGFSLETRDGSAAVSRRRLTSRAG